MILHVVLYEYKTWSHSLRDEDELRVFKNKLLKTMRGPKKDKVKNNGKNYTTSNIVIYMFPIASRGALKSGYKKFKMVGTYLTHEGNELYTSEFGRETSRPTYFRWKDDTKVDFIWIVYECAGWLSYVGMWLSSL